MRCMKYLVVMQGHLAGFQDDVDSIGLIDFDRNLLAAREHRPLFPGVFMLDHFARMRARHHFHGTAFGSRG